MNMSVGTNPSATVTLPTNGATIYVQLETHFGSTIVENNNTYTEVTLSGGIITSPSPGSTLTRQRQPSAGRRQRRSDRVLSPHRHVAGDW